MFANFSNHLNQAKEASLAQSGPSTFSCTLYKDYLVLCDQKTYQTASPPNEMCIYNLKTKKIESIDASSAVFPLNNHSACPCKEREGILFFGNSGIGFNAGMSTETYRTVIMKLEKQENDNLKCQNEIGSSQTSLSSSAIICMDQGAMYVYEPNNKNGKFGSLYTYSLLGFKFWSELKTKSDHLKFGLNKPTHNAIFSDGVLYLLTGNITAPSRLIPSGLSPIEDVYSLDLREGNDQHKWKRVSPSGQTPGFLTNISLAQDKGVIYVFGLRKAEEEKMESVLWKYDTKSKKWNEVEERSTLQEARPNQRAVIYQRQLIVVDWDPSDRVSPVKLQYHSLEEREDNPNKNSPSLFKKSDVEENNAKQKKKEVCKDHSDDFMRDSKTLYESRVFPDITFQVGGEDIPAHKAILASRCGYFMKIFTSGMAESKSSKISIPNMKPHVFQAILQYLYCNEIELDEELAVDLIPVVDEYVIKSLGKLIEGYLCKHLTQDNVADILTVADRHEIEELKKVCCDFIVKSLSIIDKEKELTKLSQSLLIDLLSFSASGSLGDQSGSKNQNEAPKDSQSSSSLFPQFANLGGKLFPQARK